MRQEDESAADGEDILYQIVLGRANKATGRQGDNGGTTSRQDGMLKRLRLDKDLTSQVLIVRLMPIIFYYLR